MKHRKQYEKYKESIRKYELARAGEDDLGPLSLLPGTWKSKGRGWNLIALPFEPAPFNYRLLMNQYNETLKFSFVDKGVPNRGLPDNPNAPEGRRRHFCFTDDEASKNEGDQFLVALDYEQVIDQVAVDDFPASNLRGPVPKSEDDDPVVIHHEPGLFLFMTNKTTSELDVARLGTIPHGDSLLGLGRSEEIEGAANIPPLSGLPIGVPTCDLGDPKNERNYLQPYSHFEANPFVGNVTIPGFPGFTPTDPNNLLRLANQGVNIKRTIQLPFDTTLATGGIVNIPFVVKQANAAEMKSTFWIQVIEDEDGQEKYRLQYSQVVILDFFGRRDGSPGQVRWPHVSINTLEKVEEKPDKKYGKKDARK